MLSPSPTLNLSQTAQKLLEVASMEQGLFGLGAQNITIFLTSASTVTVDDIRKVFPSGPVVACDFHLEGAHEGERVALGFRLRDILNIDHHAPIPEMRRRLSSGNIAIEHVKNFAVIDDATPICGNHFDCDTVISILIMRGLLPPHQMFADAVIAADHTGEANDIADLLQSLKDRKNFAFSVRNLGLLLSGQALDLEAEKLLQKRLRTRKEVAAYPSQIREHSVCIATPHRVDAELLPALYPEAKVIMSHHVREDKRLEVRLRLGKAAPKGFTLNSIAAQIKAFDPRFGGRWNAGSNERAGHGEGGEHGENEPGGTALSASDYHARLEAIIAEQSSPTETPGKRSRG